MNCLASRYQKSQKKPSYQLQWGQYPVLQAMEMYQWFVKCSYLLFIRAKVKMPSNPHRLWANNTAALSTVHWTLACNQSFSCHRSRTVQEGKESSLWAREECSQRLWRNVLFCNLLSEMGASAAPLSSTHVLSPLGRVGQLHSKATASRVWRGVHSGKILLLTV